MYARSNEISFFISFFLHVKTCLKSHPCRQRLSSKTPLLHFLKKKALNEKKVKLKCLCFWCLPKFWVQGRSTGVGDNHLRDIFYTSGPVCHCTSFIRIQDTLSCLEYGWLRKRTLVRKYDPAWVTRYIGLGYWTHEPDGSLPWAQLDRPFPWAIPRRATSKHTYIFYTWLIIVNLYAPRRCTSTIFSVFMM